MKRLALAALLLLSSCGPTEVEQLRQENRELKAQLEDTRAQAEKLKEASDDLQAQLARFESENWQDVMPEAKAAGDNVESAQQELSETVDQEPDTTATDEDD